MSLTVVTAPAIKPISLEEAKKHLRLALDDDSEDWLVNLMIESATDDAEDATNRSLINRVLRLRVYAASSIELSKPPFVNVSSVKLINAVGVETVLEDGYEIDTVPLVPVLVIDNLGDAKYVQIEYTAGYGATMASVPAKIKKWMLCQINTMNEFREEFIAGTLDAQPGKFINGLLDKYRIVSAH